MEPTSAVSASRSPSSAKGSVGKKLSDNPRKKVKRYRPKVLRFCTLMRRMKETKARLSGSRDGRKLKFERRVSQPYPWKSLRKRHCLHSVSPMGKKPPSFPHVHPSRGTVFPILHVRIFIQPWAARKFKKAWVEKAKITSKWKAQKKREGLIEKAKLDIPRDNPDEPSPTTPPGLPRGQAVPQKTTTRPNGDDVREMTRKAYSKSSLHTYKSDPLKKYGSSAREKRETGNGQPDMKLRMNALLAKIKRDYA